MHEFGTILIANMTYTRLQNYKIMMVGRHGIQTCEVVVVVLLLLFMLFDVFVPTSAHPLLFLEKWSVQIYLSVGYNDTMVKSFTCSNYSKDHVFKCVDFIQNVINKLGHCKSQ